MTDRHTGYLVVLKDDIREDDGESILTALLMVKGVLTVTPIVEDGQQAIADARASAKWRDRLYKLAAEAEVGR